MQALNIKYLSVKLLIIKYFSAKPLSWKCSPNSSIFNQNNNKNQVYFALIFILKCFSEETGL